MSKTIILSPIILTVILWFVFIENTSNLKLITIYIKEWKVMEEMSNKFNISILTTDPLIIALIDDKKDEAFIKALNEKNIKYDSIDSSVVLQELYKMKSNTTSRVRGFDYENRYHTLEEIYTELDRIKSSKTDGSIDVFSIGRSYENREIKVIKISKGLKVFEIIVVIECGVHSNEWLAIAFCMYAINKLLNVGYEEPFLAFSFIIIPVLNPDGYKNTWKMWHFSENPDLMRNMTRDQEFMFWKSRLHRKNMQITYPQNSMNVSPYCDIGTDLNRNFHTPNWCGGRASRIPCDSIYCGSYPFSAPETRALRRYLSSISHQISLYFSFHAYMGMWTFPWAYTRDPPPHYDILSKWARQSVDAMNKVYGADYTSGQLSVELYPAGGGSVDWAYDELRVWSFIFEMWPIVKKDDRSPRRPFLNFLVPEFGIRPACVETMVGINVTLASFLDHVLKYGPSMLKENQENSALSYQYMSSILTIIIVFVFAYILRYFRL